MDNGLVGGEGFATDASIIRADANRQNHINGGDDHDWTGGAGGGKTRPSRAVRDYLKGLDREAAPPKEISLSDPASRLPPSFKASVVLPPAPNSTTHVALRSSVVKSAISLGRIEGRASATGSKTTYPPSTMRRCRSDEPMIVGSGSNL